MDFILGSSFSALGLAARLREYNVKKVWAECVGKAVAKKAAPSRLIGKTLYCIVSSAPWMTELNFQKPSIIKKLNERLCEEAVSGIVFKPGKVEAPEERPPETEEKPRELTGAERSFIDRNAEKIPDADLKDLVKRVMEKSKTRG